MTRHPLAHLIPDSNAFDLRAMPYDRMAGALESLYSNHDGFVGCFLADEGDWQARIDEYDAAEFRYDTPGRKKLWSDIHDVLSTYEADGCHVNTSVVFDQWEKSGRGKFGPFTIYQNFGICVDASLLELMALALARRAAESPNEEFAYLPAFYLYAARGYCNHGWTMSACASRAMQYGWCPAMQLDVNGHSLDFDEEDDSEYTVARDWCRSGIPAWLADWTKSNFAWHDGAITEFDGTDLAALQRLFANGGQLHHGSNYTSASGKPNNLRRIGGHAQTAFGADWSDKTLAFLADRGVRYDKGDFPVANHQTWGAGWSGEVDDEYWPSWWGPKPQGAWVCSGKQLLEYFNSRAFAYLPLLDGWKAETPEPAPLPVPTPGVAQPPLTGTLSITVDGKTFEYVAVPRPRL